MIGPKTLAALLFGIHSHHPEDERIIYYDDDLQRLFEAIGLSKSDVDILLEDKSNKHPDNDDVIHYEDDILESFDEFEIPEPEWGAAISIDDYIKNKTSYD